MPSRLGVSAMLIAAGLGSLVGCNDGPTPGESRTAKSIDRQLAPVAETDAAFKHIDDQPSLDFRASWIKDELKRAAREEAVITRYAKFSDDVQADAMTPPSNPQFGPATRLVQAPLAKPASSPPLSSDDPSASPSLSDTGPIEVVPTPQPRPEMKGELIPTPQGLPESFDGAKETPPMARIAADVADSKAEAPSKDLTAPALIDPTTEAGMVAGDGPEDYNTWPAPDVLLFFTGNQHGYIEPCGCTGLENQKGGVARRYTFMEQLRKKGWDLIPVDAGNQIRRIVPQAAIKFERSTTALKEMKYQAVGYGPSDLRIGAGDLIAMAYSDEQMFVSGNVTIFEPELLPTYKVIRRGEWKIGVTSILDPDALEAATGSDITVSPMKEAAQAALKSMNGDGAEFRVLTFFGEEEAAKKLMTDVQGFDLIVVSGGYGEPLYRPQPIEGSKTKLIVTGNKGMYAGLVGLYQNQPMKYARVALTHEFEDAPEMRKLMADYQKQLEQLGFSGLGITPMPHRSGNTFVGSEACKDCHENAYDIWEGSMHALATEHLVEPPAERGDVPRHFDPECLSCHVTGWNPQGYYPYKSGYMDLTSTAHLGGNGCENCHGPGSAHVAAESNKANTPEIESLRKKLRLQVQLPIEKAREHCMECHDLDNSPDFHDEGAFEDIYWPEIEHND
ncbi:multiheme c-type cytochrome [Roseiconus lacunae]|uniref:multiheme c-type cytochrome n=1 Tax=Roseiconus lacunae TaxID=2605694 RepID=UPI001E2FF37D|nr:multiheme c-type cytochrome [Roseiconus lacunae]MCD0463598.1 cytochrome C554 [Roseiconus lacunae]